MFKPANNEEALRREADVKQWRKERTFQARQRPIFLLRRTIARSLCDSGAAVYLFGLTLVKSKYKLGQEY
jgi:hypothetical protein